jgi:hypothetical protein
MLNSDFWMTDVTDVISFVGADNTDATGSINRINKDRAMIFVFISFSPPHAVFDFCYLISHDISNIKLIYLD